MTRFLFIYRGDPAVVAQIPPDMLQQNMQRWQEWLKEGLQKGWLVEPGDALTNQGKVVSPTKVVTDGPYAEVKELVGGFSIVQAPSIEAAADLAKTCPHLLYRGNVEVRQLAGFKVS